MMGAWVGIDGEGSLGLKDLDYEKEHRHALAWLKLAFPLAHKDSDTKHWIKRLLAVNYFTVNMSYMQILEPLRTFCGERLLLAGAPLQALFQSDGDVRGLAELAPPPLEAVAQVAHLRQDHPAVGLAPPPGADPTTLEGESVYIHFLRLVALALNEKFQTLVRRVVKPLGGKKPSAAIFNFSLTVHDRALDLTVAAAKGGLRIQRATFFKNASRRKQLLEGVNGAWRRGLKVVEFQGIP